MNLFTVDGNPVVCSDGCIQVCNECREEMGDLFIQHLQLDDDGGPTKAYIGSGEDVVIPTEKKAPEPEFFPA